MVTLFLRVEVYRFHLIHSSQEVKSYLNPNREQRFLKGLVAELFDQLTW